MEPSGGSTERAGSRHPRGAGNKQLNLAIMAMQAGTSVQAENKGRLGDPAPLKSVITVKKGGDMMMVGCLFDGGSESSYFHPSGFLLSALKLSGKWIYFAILVAQIT